MNIFQRIKHWMTYIRCSNVMCKKEATISCFRCGKMFCPDHLHACSVCGADVCTYCLDPHNGLCSDTCYNIEQAAIDEGEQHREKQRNERLTNTMNYLAAKLTACVRGKGVFEAEDVKQLLSLVPNKDHDDY